jgi:hypothetical protein
MTGDPACYIANLVVFKLYNISRRLCKGKIMSTHPGHFDG